MHACEGGRPGRTRLVTDYAGCRVLLLARCVLMQGFSCCTALVSGAVVGRGVELVPRTVADDHTPVLLGGSQGAFITLTTLLS